MPVSPLRMQVLPAIWMLLALLARIAEKAQSLTMLFETITLLARKTLMPLPFCPVPPLRAAMRLTRLPEDDRAVVGRLPAMHEDAAIGAVGDAVAGDLQAGRLDRIDAGVGRAGDLGALDAAADALERDAVLAAADDLAIVDHRVARRA